MRTISSYGVAIILLCTNTIPSHPFLMPSHRKQTVHNTFLDPTYHHHSNKPLTNENGPITMKPTAKTQLFAEGGPPQYEKIDAELLRAETVGEGSAMLHIRASRPIDYEPGHVVALEMEDPSSSPASNDTIENSGWMRGPYTVSRCVCGDDDDGQRRDVDIMIKIVGAKSRAYAAATPGTPLKIGGKFKVPILEGIREKEMERVVMISTGVGIGPCVGAIEKALASSSSFPPITLIASFRNEEEVIFGDYLNELELEHSPDRLRWKPIITSRDGRLSSSEPNLKSLLLDSQANEIGRDLGLSGTHYHLIGNGQMVNEFKAGLSKAGVPDDCVTLEMYFNHKATISDDVVDRIATFISKYASVNSNAIARG